MTNKIKYDGKYPNLCSGNLIITINNIEYQFPAYCLSSGGSVSFSDEGSEIVTEGEWTIKSFPENFPVELKQTALDLVNEHIPYGCCGGCI